MAGQVHLILISGDNEGWSRDTALHLLNSGQANLGNLHQPEQIQLNLVQTCLQADAQILPPSIRSVPCTSSGCACQIQFAGSSLTFISLLFLDLWLLGLWLTIFSEQKSYGMPSWTCNSHITRYLYLRMF